MLMDTWSFEGSEGRFERIESGGKRGEAGVWI